MIFDRIMLPAQGRNEDYKFAQTGSVTLVASVGSSGGGTPAPSWLENIIKIDAESGYPSVQDWHVKGNLVLEGQVNQWLAQQLVIEDARIQVNRKQGGAVADSGLVIFDKDTSSEVSSLVYDVNGIWRAGSDRLFTEAYNPKLGGLPAADYALKTWVENSATAYNAARLGGYAAASYPRKAEAATITGAWTFRAGEKHLVNIVSDIAATAVERISGIKFGRVSTQNTNHWEVYARSNDSWGLNPDFHIELEGSTQRFPALKISSQPGTQGFVGFGLTGYPTERLHVAGNGRFTGNLTAVNAALSGTLAVTGASTFGGNVGTANFASQTQGWRVTPAGIADFRHIYTDELQAKAFTADISQALVGSDVLTKSVAKLAQNFKIESNGTYKYLYVEELEGYPGMSVFSIGDKLRLRVFDRSGGGLIIADVWVTVITHNINDTVNNVQRYTVQFDDDGGVVGSDVYRGSMVLDYGTSGSGVIERTVLDQQGSPYSRVSTWVNNPWTPENYTLHYQSGNLNGIANAEGWGVYSQNSFLTGKLLVGDLTKAGQYMEYENGQLNIKGQITVTGGNAATKEDVDAVQVGGRNLVLNSDQEISVAVGYAGANSNLIEVDKGQQVAISFDVKTTADYNGNIVLVQYFDDSGVRQGYEWISGEVTTNWIRVKRILTMPTTSWFTKVSLGYRSTTPASQVNTFRRAKLETGNRATDWTPAPEDVDAGIASAESAAKGYADGAATAAESAAKTFATAEANAALTAAEGYTDSLKDRVENTLGLADLEGINQTLITGGKVRTSLLEATDIVAAGITAGHVEGLTLNFDKGKIANFNIINNWLYSGNFNAAQPNNPPGTGLLLDASARKILIQHSIPSRKVEMYYTDPYNWGLLGVKDGATVFQLGSDNYIAGINFDDSKLSTPNWELNKDGSFYFGAGGEIEGSLITGVIESSNWDGVHGSSFDLHNGHLLIGDAIRMSGDVSEIQVKDRDTGLYSFKIGDFTLSPTNFAGAGVDVALSSSPVTASPAAGSYQLNRTVYVSSSGGLMTSTSYISNSLIAGGTYSIGVDLKVALQLYQQVTTVPFILDEKYVRKGGNGIKAQLKNGNTVVWDQNISTIPANGVVPLFIYTSFQAGSQLLQLIITIDGEYEYRQPVGSETRIYNTEASIERFDGSSRLVLLAQTSRMEFSTRGMQAVFSTTNYFRCDKLAIEGRGNQTFISPDGNYRLRVSNTGIEKKVGSGSWTPL